MYGRSASSSLGATRRRCRNAGYIPRPTTHTTSSAAPAPASRRSPGRMICAAHATAVSAASTASAPSIGSVAWTSVYEAPKTRPRGEKTIS